MGVTRVRHPYIENVVEVEKRACHVHVSVPHLEKERAFIWKLCLCRYLSHGYRVTGSQRVKIAQSRWWGPRVDHGWIFWPHYLGPADDGSVSCLVP